MTRGALVRTLVALAALGTLAAETRVARAQDFASGATPLESPGPARLLEHALPAAGGSPALALAHVRWHDLPELATRSLAGAAGWRALRFGAGLSQTGDAATGWTSVALGLGWAEEGGGMGVRVVARRDRTAGFAFDTGSPAWGLEAGAGGWIALDDAWRVWASAPSLWSDGQAPPLARPLGFGASWRGAGARAWLAHAAAPSWAGGAGGGMAGGVALGFGPAWLWAAGRDHPARPSLGVEVAARGVRVIAGAESHPVLGTTTKLAIALGRARRAAAAAGETP